MPVDTDWAAEIWINPWSYVAPSTGVEAARSRVASRRSWESRERAGEQTCLSAASFMSPLSPILPWQQDGCLRPHTLLSEKHNSEVIILVEIFLVGHSGGGKWIRETWKWWKTIHCLYLLPHLSLSMTYLPRFPGCPTALFSNWVWDPALIKGIKRCDQIVTTSTVRSPIWQSCFLVVWPLNFLPENCLSVIWNLWLNVQKIF